MQQTEGKFIDSPKDRERTSFLFDPIEVARATEKIVCDRNRRRYTRFGSTINYRSGIATGYAVGCCLRCVFCWASHSRDSLTQSADFYAPDEVFDNLYSIAIKKKLYQIRISDGEPTIGKEHLFELLELAERSILKRFVLETNGILMGSDKEYITFLTSLRKVVVRVSLKGGTATDFSRKTGAVAEAFELPFEAIRRLKEKNVCFWVAAMSADPRFISAQERVSMIVKLGEIDPALVTGLEEEVAVLYPDTIIRLKKAGWDLSTRKFNSLQRIPVLGRVAQVAYRPVPDISREGLSIRYSFKAIRELIHGT